MITSTFRQHQQILQIPTQGKSLHNLNSKIQTVVQQSGVKTGLCTVFVRHTSASLIIQENADPDVLRDLESFFAQLVPEEGRRYRHSTEGLDDMPAHIRCALTKTSEQIPIVNSCLGLGTWQGIFLWEHRQSSNKREIIIHINGEA